MFKKITTETKANLRSSLSFTFFFGVFISRTGNKFKFLSKRTTFLEYFIQRRFLITVGENAVNIKENLEDKYYQMQKHAIIVSDKHNFYRMTFHQGKKTNKSQQEQQA